MTLFSRGKFPLTHIASLLGTLGLEPLKGMKMINHHQRNTKGGMGKLYKKRRREGTILKLELHLSTRGGKNNMEVGSKALSEEKEKEDGAPNKEDQGKEANGSEQSSNPSCFDELISLGGEHFTFGTFKEMEIKDIYTDCNLMRQAQWHSTNMGQIYTSTSMTPFL
jgi:hypothetical protein